MQKSPIRDLFDALCEHESLIVSFATERDANNAKIRLHQIRKETDDQLSSIGDTSGIFGGRSILFDSLGDCQYKIYLGLRHAAKRATFQIVTKGEICHAPPVPAYLGESKGE